MTATNGDICKKCGILGEEFEVGTASNRPHYRCSQCGATWWRKNPAAVELGKLGGRKAAQTMTAEQKSARGEKGGNALWKKIKQTLR